MKAFKDTILRNRHALLCSVIVVYVAVLVIEGAITGRAARVVEFENPFFDLQVQDFEEFRQDRDRD